MSFKMFRRQKMDDCERRTIGQTLTELKECLDTLWRLPEIIERAESFYDSIDERVDTLVFAERSREARAQALRQGPKARWMSCVLFGHSIPREQVDDPPEEPESILVQGPRLGRVAKPFLMASGGWLPEDGHLELEFTIMNTARLTFVCLEGNAQLTEVFAGNTLLYNGTGIRWAAIDQTVLPGVRVRAIATPKGHVP